MDTCNVIIVTYNNESTIAECLASLPGQPIQQVILVDNGSSDRTLSLANGCRAELPFLFTVIPSTNTGFAGGYATASKYVQRPDLPTLCLNPDVILNAQAIDGLLAAMALSDDVAIATAPLVDASGGEDSASRRRLPTLGLAAAYSLFGRILPNRLRYNSRPIVEADCIGTSSLGHRITRLEATTGALMMVSPAFRPANRPIFDTDYWMYGEDLQLCYDAGTSGRRVVLVEMTPSMHKKGTSSGWPRSAKSHRAFHDALYTYYRKNLRSSYVEDLLVRLAIEVRHETTRVAGLVSQKSLFNLTVRKNAS